MEINDPRIEAYLNGEMTPEEIAVFEAEAKQSPETWEHIQFQQYMIEGIRLEGAAELKDFIANRISEDEQNESTKTGLWWSIAATFVVLAVGLFINYRSAERTLESKLALSAADSTTVNNSDSNIAMNEGEPKENQNTRRETESYEQSEAEIQYLPPIEETDDVLNQMGDVENPPTYGGTLKEEQNIKGETNDNSLSKNANTAPLYLGKINLTPISLNEEIKANATATAPLKSVAKPRAKMAVADTIQISDANIPTGKKAKSKMAGSPSKQYTITLIEQNGESPWLMITANTATQSNFTLCNAGSVDVLLFEINQQLYLQLGNQYYFYPMNAPVSVKQKLTPVANANILKLLNNR